jgi:HTH-type transcriptional regulator/antitoxin HigA
VRLVNEIIAGKRGISSETAKGLADAFGTSAQFWMNLDSAYQLSRTRDPDGSVSKRSRLYSKAPMRELIRRRWIEPSDNVDVLEKRLCDFFEIEDLNDDPVFLKHAARKSTSYDSTTSAQKAWLFHARRLAHTIPVRNAFSLERLREGIENLRLLLKSPDLIRQVPHILADAGVRLLVVEALPNTRIDGACFWLDSESPVIVLSLRFDRIDYFWHTLMHELGHVMRRDGIDDLSLDTDLVGGPVQSQDEKPESEKEADRFAVETLVPQESLEDFITRTRPFYSKLKIKTFAQQVGVHPGIVVGQLHHRGEFSYSNNREMLVKVRHIITSSATTDGWGQVLRVA